MMDWLREIFYLFQIAFAYFAIIPIFFGGILLAWTTSKIINPWIRMPTQAIIVVLQALGFMGFVDRLDVTNLLFFVPFWSRYPYLNMAALLFFWIPVIAQLVYVNKHLSPKPWLAAVIAASVGVAAIIAGCVFLFIGGVAVGAQSD